GHTRLVSAWSSDVCSSDLGRVAAERFVRQERRERPSDEGRRGLGEQAARRPVGEEELAGGVRDQDGVGSGLGEIPQAQLALGEGDRRSGVEGKSGGGGGGR